NETVRNHPTTLDHIKQIVATDRDASLVINSKSGRAALLQPTTSIMDEEGTPIKRVMLTRPMQRDRFFEAEIEHSHWMPASDAAFEAAWADEISRIPEFTNRRLTLVSGLLLPIWNKLPDENCRVYRLE